MNVGVSGYMLTIELVRGDWQILRPYECELSDIGSENSPDSSVT